MDTPRLPSRIGQTSVLIGIENRGKTVTSRGAL
jgi:hypothetical protein